MNDLQVAENEISENKLIEYLDSTGMTNKLQPNEKKMFVNIAREFHLNPFKREIHVSVYGEGQYRNLSIITGYEVYIKRAERTGKLNGWKCWTEGVGNNLVAKIQIFRKDWDKPFEHEVYYEEAAQFTKDNKPNRVWSKMPKFMLRKVCIGQGFRLCFSDDLGGMPYEEVELPQEDVTPQNEIATEKDDMPIGNFPNYGMTDDEGNTLAPTRDEILEYTAEILKALNPEGIPFFSVDEIQMERIIAKEAKTLGTLQEQSERLEKELYVRQEAYKNDTYK